MTYSTIGQGRGANTAVALSKNEMRHYLATGEMPSGFRERVELALEFEACENCDDRKCMGCVFREYDHECGDTCPSCCPTGEPQND